MLLLLLVACPRSVPPALEVDPPAAATTAAEPTEASARLAWMLGRDPLARRPRLPTLQVDDAGLAAWTLVAAEADPRPEEWWRIEAAYPGTVAVPLARGARLAGIEAAVADPEAALDLLLPLSPARMSPEHPRSPLDCVGAAEVGALLPIAERQVLLGWLDGPGIDVAPAAALLATPDWDRLSRTPTGAAVLARARAAHDAAAAERGRVLLADATTWALQRAAADRPTEQAALKARRTELQAAYTTTNDPAAPMLAAARTALLADAGDDTSMGLVLVALAGERFGRPCADAPCGGLDRVRALVAAGRWPGASLAADAWTLLALKEARDHLEVAYSEPSFPGALDEVVEAMLAQTAVPFDRGLLLQPRAGPVVHLAVTRALSGAEETSKAGMFAAIDRTLVKIADRVLAQAAGAPWSGVREPVERIRRRSAAAAVPPTVGPAMLGPDK